MQQQCQNIVQVLVKYRTIAHLQSSCLHPSYTPVSITQIQGYTVQAWECTVVSYTHLCAPEASVTTHWTAGLQTYTFHTFQPNSDSPDVYAKGKVPITHSWMWRPQWPAADAREIFLNLATGVKPEGRAELCSTEYKRCSGIRWLTQVHLKPARNWLGWVTLTRLEESERTAPHQAPWNGHWRDHTTLSSDLSHLGKTGGSPLGAVVLFHACPSPAIPSQGTALLAPGQSSDPSLQGMALPGRAAWLKVLRIRSLSAVCSPEQLVTAFI